MKFLKDLITEDDGESYCIARVLLLASFISFVGFSGYEVYNTKAFRMTDFGTGIMTILTGGAAVIGAKQITTKT